MPSVAPGNLPPDLGPDAVAVLEGRTFMYSNVVGDVPPGSIGGLVHDDTRFLSKWQLTINGAPFLVLSGGTVDDYSAAFFLTNPDVAGLRANTVGARRQRFVGDGLYECIMLECFGKDPVSCQLRLAVGVDFADLFEIKDVVRDRSAQITRSHAADGSRLAFDYRNRIFEARTEVIVDPPASHLDGDVLVWDLYLEPASEWRCGLQVPLHFGPEFAAPVHRSFHEVVDGGYDPTMRWMAGLPTMHPDSDLLGAVIQKSIVDLVALRIEKCPGDRPILLPAAGLPWFLTIFGRDTLITAYQTVCFGQELSRGALLALGHYQGRRVDEFRDEEPGKILHEVRSGELTRLGVKPHDPYFGSADSTALWLILLSEYWRFTHDEDLVVRLRDQAYAALQWIDTYGDRDGDGYVEYATRSPQGLGNHCWRDSWDGIQHADGSMPVLPIATCEIQGYTYDAKLRLAELAGGPLNDPSLAARLRVQAEELYHRFNRDFWVDQRGGFYAVGLDGDKRHIDSMTSNMGQLLWSGIVPQERAAVVVGHLMSDHLFSGWGVRTTSSMERCYNPIGYHVGTVWPHDNSLIAHGMARYGFRDEANRIILAMLEAAEYNEFRLPEALSGYDRSVGRRPVPFPTACSPQAWASGAPVLFVRTLLGLDAQDGRLVLSPHLPPEFGRLLVTGTNAFGRVWDLEASGRQEHVRLARL